MLGRCLPPSLLFIIGLVAIISSLKLPGFSHPNRVNLFYSILDKIKPCASGLQSALALWSA